MDEDPEEDPEEDEDMIDETENLKNEQEVNATEEIVNPSIKSGDEKEQKDETGKDKVFRFGHIRVEDMWLIIHNLGKFLSHRDVKDLIQSALLESNTGRDDRILYNKLVRMDI
ncbi:hypothetical protein M8C21_000124 [Ambrosia artemisiifolia]|uniref:Uncharacterized protein n=1 Tax=Ambrosia artemisiifolia TaxID=4212 RepID=A0AAD5GMS1_AMBAR|nr:hypothetical protein M8C21_000124 [Ambrosia artemisiifolia]